MIAQGEQSFEPHASGDMEDTTRFYRIHQAAVEIFQSGLKTNIHKTWSKIIIPASRATTETHPEL